MIKSELHQNGANSKLSPKFGFEINPPKILMIGEILTQKKEWAHYFQEIDSQFFLYVNRGVSTKFHEFRELFKREKYIARFLI